MLRYRYFASLAIWLVLVSLPATPVVAAEKRKTQNVILVTLDGLRSEELFRGADKRLINKDAGGVRDLSGIESRFWSDDAEQRRRNLLPFFWETIVPSGQVFGDLSVEAPVTVTNGLYFSYPGYNEILCGFADPAILSNAKKLNKNVTVLEWLNRREPYRDQVAAFCGWDVFPYIINNERSGIYVNAGWQELDFVADAEKKKLWNDTARELPKVWPGVRYDMFTANGAIEYLKLKRPRVMYVALGETDDWAHDGRYDLYLDSARRSDDYLQELWKTVQSLDTHRDCTTLIITTDHGRGDGRDGWKSHGVTLNGSNLIWIAIMGPDTPALGIRRNIKTTQSQVAATLAHLLGEDYASSDKRIGKPLDVTE